MAYIPVLVDSFRKKQFLVTYAVFGLLLAICLGVSFTGPSQLIVKDPSGGQGTNLDLATTACTHNASDAPTAKIVQQCWNHKFQFNAHWTQYFSLDVLIRPSDYTPLPTTKTVNIKVTWLGQKRFSGVNETFGPWEPISSSNFTRQVQCDPSRAGGPGGSGSGGPGCNPFIVFKASHVKYQRYFFQIEFLQDPADLGFIKDVSFVFIYQNSAFARYEMGFKIGFSIINILALFAYVRQRRKVLGERMISPEQRWVLLLLGALLLFNNPLYPLLYYPPARPFFGALSLIFQFSFIAFLMFYWLCLFDKLAVDEEAHLSFKRFYLPKLLYCSCFYVVGIMGYTAVTLRTAKDPVYNWYEDTDHFVFIQAYALALAGSYALLTTFYITRAFHSICCKRNVTRDNVETAVTDAAGGASRAWILFLHLFVVVVSVLGMAFGRLQGLQLDTALDFLFYHGLFNAYVGVLSFLFQPVPLPDAEQRAALAGAMHSATLDEAEVEIAMTEHVRKEADFSDDDTI